MNKYECMTFYAQAAKVDSRLPEREIDEFDAYLGIKNAGREKSVKKSPRPAMSINKY